MSGKGFAALAGAGVAIVLLAVPPVAHGIDLTLPGERRLEIHGFYEMRLRFFGEDLPANGITFSQFRHVVDIETDIEIFPEGIGPFDTMVGFTRWIASYECIYERSCGLASAADSFGGAERDPVRLPRNFKSARTFHSYAGGVIPTRTFPGTLVPSYQRLNPDDRFVTCRRPDGVFANPFPLSAFCNLENRSRLDRPIDDFATFDTLAQTRAGAFNIQLRQNLLTASRARIGEERFTELQGLLDGGAVLSNRDAGQVRLLQAQAILEDDPAKLEEANALLAGTFDAAIPELLDSRPDVDQFAAQARANAPELLTMLWGSTHRHDVNLPWLASIDTPIRPTGYFRSSAVDLVSEVATGLAQDLNADQAELVIPEASRRAKLIPLFVGPDGVQNTLDDLPVERFVNAQTGDPSDASDPDALMLYNILGTDVSQDDCVGLTSGEGGVNANGECIRPTLTGGSAPAGADADTILGLARALQDPGNRPDTAVLEPSDLTDLVLRARRQGKRGLPGRPPNPDGGLWYRTPGYNRLIAEAHDIVSSLDVDFTEDELRWDHGASQDAHEFREGYLEFEMFDSEIFARVGSLLMVWGKTELFRNQDRLNPLDIGLGTLSRLEESRIGQWAADVVYSPEWAMQLGPFEDLRVELVALFDDFEPTDLGKCGENLTFEPVCGKAFGAMAAGLTGLGLVGEVRPDDEYGGLKRLDYGFRLEGRMDRFTFAITDFWGWDDGFYVDLVHQYGRTIDAATGAPTAIAGGTCTYRTDAEGQRVGPNGVAGDNDDSIPSGGDCLLWEPPGENGKQRLRQSEAIALLHNTNQTLFHTICTLTYDEENGFCALDIFNSSIFSAVSSVLSGTGFADAAIGGTDSIRLNADTFAGRLNTVGSEVLGKTFVRVDLLNAPDVYAASNESPEAEAARDKKVAQQALLGCGPAWATACGFEAGQSLLGGDPAAAQALEIGGSPVGGVDVMNADASVITQEFSILKVGSPGALVGTRLRPEGLAFEPGISGREVMDADEAASLGDSATAVAQGRLRALGLDESTDLQVERWKWVVDEDEFERTGALVAIDPRGENGVWEGGTNDDIFDALGENCTPLYGGPDPGCSELEKLSANIERLLIVNEIVGQDEFFDPPESIEEMLAMLDGDVSNDPWGDPVAGRDGIPFLNYDDPRDDQIGDGELDGLLPAQDPSEANLDPTPGVVDPRDYRNDHRAIAALDVKLAGSGIVVVQDAADCATQLTGTRGYCYLEFEKLPDPTNTQLNRTLISALPVGMRLRDVDSGAVVVFNPHELSLEDLNILYTENGGDDAVIEIDIDGDGVKERLEENTVGTGRRKRTEGTSLTSTNIIQDLDDDKDRELDEDKDEILDLLDDGIASPVSDDNILCGSGIPGDILQDAIQFEFADSSDLAELMELFPNGFPKRSPLFCRGVNAILGVTGYTLPFRRAGGDGSYGRRDFLWHGGRQLALRYQKTNVLGFSLDFAEDRTKSSWGIEFSYTSGKLFANSLSYNGLHRSDEYVLTISVDRPTFFNFLNPNRSFFVNFQFFIRYLSDYVGGSDDLDGMFGTAEGPLSTFVTLTTFTGYFQDRLNPRFTIVYDPMTSTGAILTGIGYKWTDSFSTTINFNHFFGHITQAQAAYFPAALRNHPNQTAEIGRGLSVVKNRDVAIWTLRYTW